MIEIKKMLNTLYITTDNTYLGLDGENIVVKQDNSELGRVPLHNLEGIISFGYIGASPALMYACAEKSIGLTFLNPYGKFLARVVGKSKGNILLRKKQYIQSENEFASTIIARNMILGKVYNSRWVLERVTRDNPLRVDVDGIKRVSLQLKDRLPLIRKSVSLDQLRGYEGECAKLYFSKFNELILNQKKDFFFTKRTKRPPLDRVNAMLSFLYTMLVHDIGSALEALGLDAYIGYLHRDRPGRMSLALDIIEELRPVMVDRLVISLINKKIVSKNDFLVQENGAVLMTEKSRKKILNAWQAKKKEVITHPYLGEKIEWGLVPYIQGMLLARYLKEDINEYPPFFWK